MTTMTKKRVAELEGAQLDWAVAKAEGVLCPGCHCNTSTLREHDLLADVEVPA